MAAGGKQLKNIAVQAVARNTQSGFSVFFTEAPKARRWPPYPWPTRSSFHFNETTQAQTATVHSKQLERDRMRQEIVVPSTPVISPSSAQIPWQTS